MCVMQCQCSGCCSVTPKIIARQLSMQYTSQKKKKTEVRLTASMCARLPSSRSAAQCSAEGDPAGLGELAVRQLLRQVGARRHHQVDAVRRRLGEGLVQREWGVRRDWASDGPRSIDGL